MIEKFNELSDIVKLHVMELLFDPDAFEEISGNGKQVLKQLAIKCNAHQKITKQQCSTAMGKALRWLIETKHIKVIELKRNDKTAKGDTFRLEWDLPKEDQNVPYLDNCSYCNKKCYVARGPSGKLICANCWSSLDQPNDAGEQEAG
jgi:uncharacterized Fe-S radical SAM superfamily protein PflX